jgi:uncharacterized membrane protein
MQHKNQKLWWVIAGFSAIGLISSLIQTIERISYALHPKIALTCDINAIFSCSNVFDAWQSSVFGFSNSLVCMMFFALTAGVALAGATGSEISRALRYIFHFFALFFLGFGAWYLWQSTYAIGYICVFCLACYAAVITINWAWFRLNYKQLPLKKASANKLERFVANGGDVFIAALWAMIIAFMIGLRFW